MVRLPGRLRGGLPSRYCALSLVSCSRAIAFASSLRRRRSLWRSQARLSSLRSQRSAACCMRSSWRSSFVLFCMFSCTFGTALTTYDTGQHDVVIIRDLALELGKSRSALKSHCRRRDYPFSGVRAPGSRGSLAVAISDAHAQAVRSHYSGARPHAPEGDSDLVALRELAEEFRVTPAGLRKHCRRNGYKLIALVTPASRGQQTFAVTPDDAALIRLYCQFKHWRFRPPGWILPEPKPWK